MTSDYLKQPSRSEAEAQWDKDHRRNTDKLKELAQWLRNPGETLELMAPFFAPYADAVDYGLERLNKEQAKIYKQRCREQTDG